MLRTRSALLAIAAAAATTFATAATAQAACSNAWSRGAGYMDADYDSGPAPDIDRMDVSLDSTCAFSVVPNVWGGLGDGEAAFVYIDIDGNPATGDPLLDGTDLTVATIGTADGTSPPLRGTWDGEGYDFTGEVPMGPGLGVGGFTARVDTVPIAPAISARLRFATVAAVGEDLYADFVPDRGSAPLSFRVDYSPVAPLPPVVITPVPRTPFRSPRSQRRQVTPAPKQVAPAPKPSCVVPRTKALTTSAARRRLTTAGCTVAATTTKAWSATVRKGRVVGTTIAAGRKAPGAVRLVVSKGKRPRKAKAAVSEALLRRLEALAAATR
jgi:hypothetical protein